MDKLKAILLIITIVLVGIIFYLFKPVKYTYIEKADNSIIDLKNNISEDMGLNDYKNISIYTADMKYSAMASISLSKNIIYLNRRYPKDINKNLIHELTHKRLENQIKIIKNILFIAGFINILYIIIKKKLSISTPVLLTVVSVLYYLIEWGVNETLPTYYAKEGFIVNIMVVLLCISLLLLINNKVK